MKTKRTLILTLLLMVSVCVIPQKKFQGGLTVGTGFADFRGLDAEWMANDISIALSEVMEEDFPIESYPRSFTITVGGFVTYNLRPWLGLRAAVEYVPKGMRYGGELYLSTSLNLDSEILKYSSTFNLTYLEFPLSVQLSTRSKKKVRDTWFYTNIGVAPAMNLAASYDMTLSLVEQGFNNSGVTSEVIDSESESEDLDGITATDLGVLVSAGVVFNSIGLDVKLTNGRKSIFENPEEGFVRNNNITASLWIIF
jgi:hypothetical protein